MTLKVYQRKIETNIISLFFGILCLLFFSNMILSFTYQNQEPDELQFSYPENHESGIFVLDFKTAPKEFQKYTLISHDLSIIVKDCYILTSQSDDEISTYEVLFPRSDSHHIFKKKKYSVYPSSIELSQIRKKRIRRTNFEINY